METQEEWEENMSRKLLQYLRNQIYMELRFLDVPLSALMWKKNQNIQTFATDGTFLFYSTEQLLRIFQTNTVFLERAYLHSVFHCIFSHLWVRKSREPVLWNLACDIAVEYNIDHLQCSSLFRPLSWLRKQTYEKMENQYGMVSAAGVYRYLETLSEEDMRKLRNEFFTDSHKYWPKEEKMSQSQIALQNQWDKIAKQTVISMDQQGKENSSLSARMQNEWEMQRGKYSYREFLRKFAALKEEMHCNPEEFDLSCYTFGLSYYGNMPLIEPCESREQLIIREFVIVVDTSYSTNGVLVEQFLRETYSILTERHYFGGECRIHIIQCDNQVQSDCEIRSARELEMHLKEFQIIGGGGTDFRPAFSYVNELLKNGTFKHLQGLLYFTDGKGIYPKQQPKYQTAFLFLDDYQKQSVPAWAMSMRILPEELKKRRCSEGTLAKSRKIQFE